MRYRAALWYLMFPYNRFIFKYYHECGVTDMSRDIIWREKVGLRALYMNNTNLFLKFACRPELQL